MAIEQIHYPLHERRFDPPRVERPEELDDVLRFHCRVARVWRSSTPWG
jgi:hypothetical protein